jgi:hypothetical protein
MLCPVGRALRPRLLGPIVLTALCVSACVRLDCSPLPCPAPGFDPDSCRCRPATTMTAGSPLYPPDAGIPAASDAADYDPTADAAGPWPACSWPSELAPRNSTTRDVCHAARALVSCQTPSGAGEICLSDDATACDGPNPFAGTMLTCHDQCAAHEYVAACGGVGPGPVPDAPAGCTFSGANPGGIAYYCCPCL